MENRAPLSRGALFSSTKDDRATGKILCKVKRNFFVKKSKIQEITFFYKNQKIIDISIKNAMLKTLWKMWITFCSENY